MPFRSELHTVLLNEKTRQGQYLYKLTETLVYYNNSRDYTLIVPTGFITDFASVPRVPFVYAAFGNTAKREAVLHDYLLAIATNRQQRFHAHRVFRDALFESYSKRRSYIMYAAVVAYDVGLSLFKRIRN